MARMSTAEAVVESLILHGITTVFGVPGVHNDPFFDACYHAGDRLRMVHTRHEQAAGYMALGAALASGKPQAFVVVPGPGLLNASAALLTAYAMNAPVLALVGQIPQAEIDRGYGHLHEIHDQLGLLATSPSMPSAFASGRGGGARRRGARHACSGRKRPVALECAIDVWGCAAEAPIPDRLPIADPAARRRGDRPRGRDPRPARNGRSSWWAAARMDAGAEVQALAEVLEAPVVSYRRGRGVIPSSHRLAVVMPNGHRLWKEADAVLAVGTRFFIQTGWGSTTPSKSCGSTSIPRSRSLPPARPWR